MNQKDKLNVFQNLFLDILLNSNENYKNTIQY